MSFDPCWEYQHPDDYRDQVLDAEEARIQQEIEDETERLPARESVSVEAMVAIVKVSR